MDHGRDGGCHAPDDAELDRRQGDRHDEQRPHHERARIGGAEEEQRTQQGGDRRSGQPAPRRRARLGEPAYRGRGGEDHRSSWGGVVAAVGVEDVGGGARSDLVEPICNGVIAQCSLFSLSADCAQIVRLPIRLTVPRCNG